MENLLNTNQMDILKHQSVTVNNCDQEPIHTPGSIQSFGYLIVVDRFSLLITQMSQNFQELFGNNYKEYLSKHINDVLPNQLGNFLTENERAIKSQPNTELIQIEIENVEGLNISYGVVIHLLETRYILELQPSVNEEEKFDKTLEDAVLLAQNATNLDALYTIITDFIQEMIQFDRVMLYKFDEDGNGKVIAESCLFEMEPFFGLHYPSTDIPKQARELYKKNTLRIIANVDAEPVKLYPAFDPDTNLPLDMSHSILRNVSPIHIEYLKNMGVKASFSMSIVSNDKLWGLIACHNYSPKSIPLYQWKSLELIAKLYSHELSNAQLLDSHKKLLNNTAKRDVFITMFTQEVKKSSYIEAFKKTKKFLKTIIDSDGLAIYISDSQNNEVLIKDGETSSDKNLKYLFKSIQNQELFYSDSILSHDANTKLFHSEIAGLLMITLSHNPAMKIMWTKKEIVQTTNWAGDPTKNVTNVQPEYELKPRNSFEIWKFIVKDKSLPWQEMELESALWLKNNLLYLVELQHLDYMVGVTKKLHAGQEELNKHLQKRVSEEVKKNEAKEQLLLQQSRLAAMGEMIAAIAHQWRQPLSTISAVLMNLEDSYEEGSLSQEYLQKLLKSADDNIHYLSSTIDDFRNFFSPSKEQKSFILEKAVIQSLVIMQAQLQSNNINLKLIIDNNEVKDILSKDLKVKYFVKGNSNEFSQALINLISNAKDSINESLKNEKTQTSDGIITVKISNSYDNVQVDIQDNGSGINENIVNRIFEPYFTTKSSRNGTGIGLYMTKLIIEDKMGGSIKASNTLNGALFSIILQYSGNGV